MQLEEWLKTDLPTLVLSVTKGKEPPLPIDILVLPTSCHSSKSASDKFLLPTDDSEDCSADDEELSQEEESKEEKEVVEIVDEPSFSEETSEKKIKQLSSSPEESVSEENAD